MNHPLDYNKDIHKKIKKNLVHTRRQEKKRENTIHYYINDDQISK